MTSMPDFSRKPVLCGEKAMLRPFQQEDIQPMLGILSDYEVVKLTGSVCTDGEAYAPVSQEETEKRTRWYQTRNEQCDRLDLAIVERATNEIVGEVVFNEYDDVTNKVNFRILVGPHGRNKGLGGEATALFVQYGFDVLNLHKIGLQVFSFNPRGEHVYVKNGFVLEGILREEFRYENEYVDTKIYGILASEYKRAFV